MHCLMYRKTREGCGQERSRENSRREDIACGSKILEEAGILMLSLRSLHIPITPKYPVKSTGLINPYLNGFYCRCRKCIVCVLHLVYTVQGRDHRKHTEAWEAEKAHKPSENLSKSWRKVWLCVSCAVATLGVGVEVVPANLT